jgi:hypothetical protein
MNTHHNYGGDIPALGQIIRAAQIRHGEIKVAPMMIDAPYCDEGPTIAPRELQRADGRLAWFAVGFAVSVFSAVVGLAVAVLS